ncbi:MAG TPA: hypothetical protein DCQ98_15985 [Planctomycetaceae bacterium]|nr:hypothetical protein [Planctomycetaceae bacterium]
MGDGVSEPTGDDEPVARGTPSSERGGYRERSGSSARTRKRAEIIDGERRRGGSGRWPDRRECSRSGSPGANRIEPVAGGPAGGKSRRYGLIRSRRTSVRQGAADRSDEHPITAATD